jgi:site-specific recombinase XerC
VRILKAKGNKQRRVPLDHETLAQLQSYVEANEIAEEDPVFPITEQWARVMQNKYAAHKKENPPAPVQAQFCHKQRAARSRHKAPAAGAGPF